MFVAIGMSAQVFYAPTAGDRWEVGADIGGVTRMKGGFFNNFRPVVSFDGGHWLSPSVKMGVESMWGVNTSTWLDLHSSTMIDHSYVGVYGMVDLFNMVCPVEYRPFTIGISAGAGWGHTFCTGGEQDDNFFATRAGLVLRYNISRRFSLNLKPAFIWDMTGGKFRQSSAGYTISRCAFSFQAGVAYRFGTGFEAVRLYDGSEIDILNGEINTLRGSLSAAQQENARLSADLAQARAARPEPIREVVVNNRFNKEFDIFFHVGSSTITNDQMPNVERIATYLLKHPGSRVEIKGYSSKDGNPATNSLLAQRRADAVKNMLMVRYRISEDRIEATGAGIGEIFEEESWNRVAVCTLTD